jgi:hypothetical protein
MRTREIRFRVTWQLYEELDKLCGEQGFKNISRYMTSLCLAAIQDKRRKTWVRGIANADPKLQDYLIDKMMSFPQDMEGMIEMIKRMDDNAKTAGAHAPGPLRASHTRTWQ